MWDQLAKNKPCYDPVLGKKFLTIALSLKDTEQGLQSKCVESLTSVKPQSVAG